MIPALTVRAAATVQGQEWRLLAWKDGAGLAYVQLPTGQLADVRWALKWLPDDVTEALWLTP